MNTRKCKKCGSSSHMARLVDSEYQVYDYRYRVCFSCEFTLESDSGDLLYFQDDERDDGQEGGNNEVAA